MCYLKLMSYTSPAESKLQRDEYIKNFVKVMCFPQEENVISQTFDLRVNCKSDVNKYLSR